MDVGVAGTLRQAFQCAADTAPCVLTVAAFNQLVTSRGVVVVVPCVQAYNLRIALLQSADQGQSIRAGIAMIGAARVLLRLVRVVTPICRPDCSCLSLRPQSRSA